MTDDIARAIAAVRTPERVVNGRIGLPSGLMAMVSLPLAATDADVLAVIVAPPNLLAQARAQSRAHQSLVLAGAPVAKQ